MNEEKKIEAEQEETSYFKGFLTALAVLGIVIIYIGICTALGFHNYWIGLVAFTFWGALGLNVELIPRIWIGAAVGILIAAAIWWLPIKLGAMAGMVAVVIIIILALWLLIIKKFSILFNDSTFIFLNIFTFKYFTDAMDTFTYLPDLAVDAVILGLIPFIIIKYLANKKAKQASV